MAEQPDWGKIRNGFATLSRKIYLTNCVANVPISTVCISGVEARNSLIAPESYDAVSSWSRG